MVVLRRCVAVLTWVSKPCEIGGEHRRGGAVLPAMLSVACWTLGHSLAGSNPCLLALDAPGDVHCLPPSGVGWKGARCMVALLRCGRSSAWVSNPMPDVPWLLLGPVPLETFLVWQHL